MIFSGRTLSVGYLHTGSQGLDGRIQLYAAASPGKIFRRFLPQLELVPPLPFADVQGHSLDEDADAQS